MTVKRASLFILATGLLLSMAGCGKSTEEGTNGTTAAGSSKLSEVDRKALSAIHDEINGEGGSPASAEEFTQNFSTDESSQYQVSENASAADTSDDAQLKALYSSFTVDPEVENGDINNLYHQVGDMVFKEDFTMTYSEAESVIESSALFPYLTNFKLNPTEYNTEGSDTYSDFMNEPISPGKFVNVEYYTDKDDELFSLSLYNPTDEEQTLADAYLNDAELREGKKYTVPEWFPHGMCAGMAYDDLMNMIETSGFREDEHGGQGKYNIYFRNGNVSVSLIVASRNHALGGRQGGSNYYHHIMQYVANRDLDSGTISTMYSGSYNLTEMDDSSIPVVR